MTTTRVEHDQHHISYPTINGIRFRLLLTADKGPPLMFLFGSGRAGTIDNATKIIDRCKNNFTIACPDQRGLGHTETPAGQWTMADYATDAFAIADHLGWQHFSILGLSFGGMVGLEMAATQPDRIHRMVLWGTSPGGTAHSYPLHTLTDLPVDEQNRIFAELMDTRLSGQWKSTPSREQRFVQAVLKLGGNPWQPPEGQPASDIWGFIKQLEARRGHDVINRLGLIQAETFIGAGFYDGLAPVVNAEIMHQKIPNSVLRVYESGHFFYLDDKAFSDGIQFLIDGTAR